MACQLFLFIEVEAINFCNAVWFLTLVRADYITNSKRIKRVIFGDTALKLSGKVSSCWVDQCDSITIVEKIFEQSEVIMPGVFHAD